MSKLNFSIFSFKSSIAVYVIVIITASYFALLFLDIYWTKRIVYKEDWYSASIVKRALSNNDPEEIPIYGSSMAQRSYIPDSIGVNFYNYGRRGSNYQKLYPLIEAEFQKERTTPVIIDFYSNFLNYNETYTINHRDFIPSANYPLVKELLESFNKYHFTYRIPGIRYFGFYSDYLEDLGRNKRELDKNLFNKGGAFYKLKTPSGVFDDLVSQRLSTYNAFTIDPNLEDRFLRAISSRPERKVILVIAPSHSSAYGTEIQYDEMVAYLKKLKSQYANVEFFSVDGRSYPDDAFKDTLHPNLKGAIRFSREFKQFLTTLNLAPSVG